jgi:hypothetical protein
MKKLISLFAVLLFTFAMPLFAGSNPQIEKFSARWINGSNNQFQVIAVVDITGVGEDFFFSWSASGTPLKKVTQYGGRAVFDEGVIKNGKWYFQKTYDNKWDFPALQFYAVARENDNYSKDTFNLPPIGNLILFNYPNPFNPVTTINYQLSTPAQVNLTVYNILGQQVATLVNSRQESGQYAIKFDGTNLASGTYIVKMKVGNQPPAIHRLNLLK